MGVAKGREDAPWGGQLEIGTDISLQTARRSRVLLPGSEMSDLRSCGRVRNKPAGSAHEVNLRILDAVRDHGVSCVVLPCCVIGEPSVPETGRDWFTWLTDQARESGLPVEYFYLNFKEQNVGFYIRGKRP